MRYFAHTSRFDLKENNEPVLIQASGYFVEYGLEVEKYSGELGGKYANEIN